MYSVDVLPVPVVRLRLLPPSPRVDRSLRLLCELVEGGGTGVPSTAPRAGGGSGSTAGRGGSSEGGVNVDIGVGVALSLVEGIACLVVVFRLTFLLCQRPCIDLLSIRSLADAL